jgi:hypothetical protein
MKAEKKKDGEKPAEKKDEKQEKKDDKTIDKNTVMSKEQQLVIADDLDFSVVANVDM